MGSTTAKIGITLSLETIECANRYRHCETSYGPRRRHLSSDEIRSWADRIRREAERLGIAVQINVVAEKV